MFPVNRLTMPFPKIHTVNLLNVLLFGLVKVRGEEASLRPLGAPTFSCTNWAAALTASVQAMVAWLLATMSPSPFH